MDLTALPPAAYAAIAKLKDIEHPSCPTNGDMVRRMPDEALAGIIMCPHSGDLSGLCVLEAHAICTKCSLDWLKDPA